jgi:hypothetical protein
VIRSSAAEYLTFIAATGDDERALEMRYEHEHIWLTQKMMATLYDVSVAAINQHIKRIFDDGELSPGATIKKYLIVQSEGNRQVRREIEHYNLQMIVAVGFKINNDRAVQFRKWAGQIVKDYTIQGWVMDVEACGESVTMQRNACSGSVLFKMHGKLHGAIEKVLYFSVFFAFCQYSRVGGNLHCSSGQITFFPLCSSCLCG